MQPRYSHISSQIEAIFPRNLFYYHKKPILELHFYAGWWGTCHARRGSARSTNQQTHGIEGLSGINIGAQSLGQIAEPLHSKIWQLLLSKLVHLSDPIAHQLASCIPQKSAIASMISTPLP